MVTLIFGWATSKSATTSAMAFASRSVKKCQNSTVPSGSAVGEAIGCVLAPGVHPAASRTATKAAPAMMRFMDCAPRSVEWGLRKGTDERLSQGTKPGVEPAEQHRVVLNRGDRDLDGLA